MASSFTLEKRPKMLKEFLIDETPSSSCSSNDGHLMKPCKLRAAGVLAFLIPRSISRRKLSRKNKEDRRNVINDAVEVLDVKVKIKDILRWKSFRDVVMEMDQEKKITISSGSSIADYNSKRSSSWSGSDFTVENLSSCCTEYNGEFINNYPQDCLVGIASKRDVLCNDEEEQYSPVSVLHSPFREDKQFFHKSLSMERRKCRLMQRIQEFETLTKLEKEQFPIEENEETNGTVDKTRELLDRIMKNRPASSDHDHLLLDFFRQELMENEANFDGEMLRLAESWLTKEEGSTYNGSLDWEMVGKREDCIRDMEKGLKWNNGFDEEQQELGSNLEIEVLNDLILDILADLSH